MKKDAQSYFRKRKKTEVVKPKEDDHLICHDINISQKATSPRVNQEGALENLTPYDLITLDDYEDDELSHTDESKGEIKKTYRTTVIFYGIYSKKEKKE